MTRDIVLVTIDCWRADAPAEMPALQALTDEYERADVVCQAPATRGAFAALLAGQYYPRVYDGFDSVRPDVTPLPAALSEYSTCGICGSNPFLSAWGGDFDHFWNDSLGDDPDSTARERLRSGLLSFRHATNHLRLRSRVTVDDVANRARDWYESTSGPRFLWMHLMDLHVPFLPGVRKGLQEGLLDTYRSHLQFMRNPDELSPSQYRTLENLYWRSVEHLDEHIERVLSFVDDDALVAIVGDHGEEFDHEKYGHARLYDECVRVPLYLSPALADRIDRVPPMVPQFDVPATILDAAGETVPTDWDGQPAGTADREAVYMLNHSPRLERAYAGIRTDRYKLFKTYDEQLRERGTEAYDLERDPEERTDVYGNLDAVQPIEDQLDAFVARDEIRSGILEDSTDPPSAAVDERLKVLGYK